MCCRRFQEDVQAVQAEYDAVCQKLLKDYEVQLAMVEAYNAEILSQVGF